MFTTVKLVTRLLIETSLRYTPRVNRKPYVVRLVFTSNILTVLGVSLDVPPVMLVSVNPLDTRLLLTYEIFLNIFINSRDFNIDFLLLRVFIRPDGKQFQNFFTRNL